MEVTHIENQCFVLNKSQFGLPFFSYLVGPVRFCGIWIFRWIDKVRDDIKRQLFKLFCAAFCAQFHTDGRQDSNHCYSSMLWVGSHAFQLHLLQLILGFHVSYLIIWCLMSATLIKERDAQNVKHWVQLIAHH